MHYLLTPLHTHVDFGFGATGNAFRTAAENLEGEVVQHPGIGNEHLPVNFLRRHAIELFLKSAIVIIHRRLDLPYGPPPSSGEPRVFVGGNWKRFQELHHRVKPLWTYLASLFRDHKDFFDSIEPVECWKFPPEVDTWIDAIDQHDPISTFFRYPTLQEPALDAKKTAMAPGTAEEIRKRLEASSDGPKQFILLMEGDDGDVKGSYYYAGEPLADFNRRLKDCVDMFHGLHAAMRVELCGGA